MSDGNAQSCFWLLDVRSLWPGNKISDAAPEILCLLSPDEQAKARAYYFLRDAKLSIGSSLLKRLFVTKLVNVPWQDVHFTRFGDPKHGKPCYNPENATLPAVDFNVTHQAGIVALVGTRIPGVQVGIDVVCVNERNERKHVEQEGFESWVEMHRDVFSDEDLNSIKHATDLTNGDDSSTADTTNVKLRRFFAYWALKEAYVKLEGEALLADWLQEVTFRHVRVPISRGTMKTVDGIEVWVKGVHRQDVAMRLEAYEEDYMVATAIKRASGSQKMPTFPELKLLDLGQDILPFASR